MQITCVSDLHGEYPDLDGGDLLIVAGDLTGSDRKSQYKTFLCWLRNQKYKKKVVIAGNHDSIIGEAFLMFETPEEMEYLRDTGTEFEGYKIWGSPWCKWFPGMNAHCQAFTMSLEIALEKMFDKIPTDTQILVTHSPQRYILDKNKWNQHCGSAALMDCIKNLPNLKLHIHGHIHEGYGKTEVMCPVNGLQYTVVNCAHMNGDYEAVNPPINITLP